MRKKTKTRKATEFLVQFGEGRLPREIAALPSDVLVLEKGDWRYSYELGGWVGWNLSHKENDAIYARRVDDTAI